MIHCISFRLGFGFESNILFLFLFQHSFLAAEFGCRLNMIDIGSNNFFFFLKIQIWTSYTFNLIMTYSQNTKKLKYKINKLLCWTKNLIFVFLNFNDTNAPSFNAFHWFWLYFILSSLFKKEKKNLKYACRHAVCWLLSAFNFLKKCYQKWLKSRISNIFFFSFIFWFFGFSYAGSININDSVKYNYLQMVFK